MKATPDEVLQSIASYYDDRPGALELLREARSRNNKNLMNSRGEVSEDFVRAEHEMYDRRRQNKVPSRLSILRLSLDTGRLSGASPVGGPGGRGFNRQCMKYSG